MPNGRVSFDPPLPGAKEATLAEILRPGAVTSVFQPIVHLDHREIVAYEALARGPYGSPLERPDRLFAAARLDGRVAELCWEARGAALTAALAGGLDAGLTLFLNAEPEALDRPAPPELEAVWEDAGSRLRVAIEITERALTARPAEMLQAISRFRERGFGIALDDVGSDTRSLALMPFLRPDVIKLDLRLVQEQPTAEIAEIVSAVRAHNERTGAIVLAEGIETTQHLASARAMGATLGQGWLFGRPGPLPSPLPGPAPEIFAPRRQGQPTRETPYRLTAMARETRPADKRLLLSISRWLEDQARGLGTGAVILSAFQTDELFTPVTRRRYSALAEDVTFVAALGAGMAGEPAPGVRGAELDGDDPLLDEWSVLVLAPHFAGALVARDCGDEGPEMERSFDYILTYDRELVVEAAVAVMTRVLPVGEH